MRDMVRNPMVNLVRSGSSCGHGGEEMQTGCWSILFPWIFVEIGS